MSATWIERHHWLVLALLLAVLTIVFVVGYYASASMQTASAQTPPYEMTRFEGEMLEIEHKAIDDAFRNQVVNVFAVWMKDGTGQPGRAINGVAQARKAYVAAKTRLEEREQNYKRSLQK